MAGSKINQHYDQYVLKGKLRHEGFERWRYVFSAVNNETNQEKKFFVELYMLNPGISPKMVIIGQKSRLALSESDLQYALAGTAAAENANEELSVKPSYILVKAGTIGNEGKQINKFIPSSHFSITKNTGVFKAGECQFTSNSLSGSIEVTAQDLRVKPELLCDTGKMDWDIKFDRRIQSEPLYNKKDEFWAPYGAKTVYQGVIHLDGQEYTITSRLSNGYSDKSWGTKTENPYFHLSSAKLTSVITGKSMLNSCFAIKGEFDRQLRGMISLEGYYLRIEEKKFINKCSIIYDCSHVPGNDGGEKIHWSVSIKKGRFVIDIDVYCKTSDLSVRDYEIPQGQRTLMKIIGSGNGSGEIRIYKTSGKDLELLEHANIYDAVCEFGENEIIGK